jgi:hypothetical protein
MRNILRSTTSAGLIGIGSALGRPTPAESTQDRQPSTASLLTVVVQQTTRVPRAWRNRRGTIRECGDVAILFEDGSNVVRVARVDADRDAQPS